MRRLAFFLLLASASIAHAQPQPETPVGATADVKVDREKDASERPRTLRFLRENQAFLRAQLDRLRLHVTWRDVDARALDERQKWMIDLGQRETSALDSLDVERERLARRTLLQRIEELAAIEAQLDRIEGVLDAQSGRLIDLDADYVGRQETALALLATGLPDRDVAALIVESIDGESIRVALDDATRRALSTGAIAQLLHDFVEPRAFAIQVSAEARDGQVFPLGSLRVEPARDRLTFVQLDLASPVGDDGALAHVVWER